MIDQYGVLPPQLIPAQNLPSLAGGPYHAAARPRSKAVLPGG